MAISESLTKRYVNKNAKVIKIEHWSKRKDGFLFLWFDRNGNVLKKEWVSQSIADQVFPRNVAKEALDYVNTPRRNWWGGLKDSIIVVGYCEDDDMYSMQDYPL
ncbi:MAG: hypothetical protein ACLFQ7_03740 [Phormidium sp.]